MWIYVSNVHLTKGKRGWTDSGAGWRTQLKNELGVAHLSPDLSGFTRIRPAIHDPRLVLEAHTAVARRTMYVGIK